MSEPLRLGDFVQVKSGEYGGFFNDLVGRVFMFQPKLDEETGKPTEELLYAIEFAVSWSENQKFRTMVFTKEELTRRGENE